MTRRVSGANQCRCQKTKPPSSLGANRCQGTNGGPRQSYFTARELLAVTVPFGLKISAAPVSSCAQPAIDVKSLHAKIGELTLENDS